MDAQKYAWTPITGLKELLQLTGGTTVAERVQLEHDQVEKVFRKNGWSQYCGKGFNYVEEAFLLTSGCIIASVSVSVFEGTFASGSDQVMFFQLTPK